MGKVTSEPDVQGELEQGENTEERFEGIQVERENAAIDECGALGVEVVTEIEGRLDPGLTGERGPLPGRRPRMS